VSKSAKDMVGHTAKQQMYQTNKGAMHGADIRVG
jgi:hypothetical protein